METYAIVVIAYNRDKSLIRLLESLNNAKYPERTDIPLIISVDKSDNEEVVRVAQEYVWEHGDKSVKLYEENLGLRQHVLLCGDLTKNYDGIIVLEDDLYVSPAFYMYAMEALDHTRGDKRIGGVSLYNHLMNVHVREPFEAVDDGYDNYYFQLASSWGQAYRSEQWLSFREWYDDNCEKAVTDKSVPINVSSWSDKSWLKYYIKYLIDTDKYFMYPRISYTTNFGDEGTHAAKGITDLQVPIAGVKKSDKYDYEFSSLDESGAVYDAFFENAVLTSRFPAATNGKVTVDLYGYKPKELYGRYVLSSKPLPYRILQSYGRNLRPIDANVLYKVDGKDFFLYDTDKKSKLPEVDTIGKYLYNYRALKAKEMLAIIAYRIKGAIPFPKKSKKTYAKGVGSRGRVGETKTDEDIVLNNDVELNEDIALNEAVAEVVSNPVINTSDAVDTVISD